MSSGKALKLVRQTVTCRVFRETLQQVIDLNQRDDMLS